MVEDPFCKSQVGHRPHLAPLGASVVGWRPSWMIEKIPVLFALRPQSANPKAAVVPPFVPHSTRRPFPWTAVAERSGDTAFDAPGASGHGDGRCRSLRPQNAIPKAARRSFLPSRRTPHVRLFPRPYLCVLCVLCGFIAFPSAPKRRGGRSFLLAWPDAEPCSPCGPRPANHAFPQPTGGTSSGSFSSRRR